MLRGWYNGLRRAAQKTFDQILHAVKVDLLASLSRLTNTFYSHDSFFFICFGLVAFETNFSHLYAGWIAFNLVSFQQNALMLVIVIDVFLPALWVRYIRTEMCVCTYAHMHRNVRM